MARSFTISLDEDAADLLNEMSADPRTQGAFLSALIRAEAGRVKAGLVAGAAPQDLVESEWQALLTLQRRLDTLQDEIAGALGKRAGAES